jgi:ABC-2 type transport system permease protein
MLIFTALSVTREIERGTMENLLSMPITPVEIMLGKIVPYVLSASCRLHYLDRRCAVRCSDHGQPCDACTIKHVVHRDQSFDRLYVFDYCAKSATSNADGNHVLLPNILLSGFMFPFAGMPIWAQWIGEALPLTHFADRACDYAQVNLSDLRYDAIAMFALMLVAMTITARVLVPPYASTRWCRVSFEMISRPLLAGRMNGLASGWLGRPARGDDSEILVP